MLMINRPKIASCVLVEIVRALALGVYRRFPLVRANGAHTPSHCTPVTFIWTNIYHHCDNSKSRSHSAYVEDRYKDLQWAETSTPRARLGRAMHALYCVTLFHSSRTMQ